MTKPRSPMVKPSRRRIVALFAFMAITAVGASFAYVHLPAYLAVALTFVALVTVWPLTLCVKAYLPEHRLWRAAVRGDAPWQMRSGR